LRGECVNGIFKPADLRCQSRDYVKHGTGQTLKIMVLEKDSAREVGIVRCASLEKALAAIIGNAPTDTGSPNTVPHSPTLRLDVIL
jgi:hypothetical protein